MITQDLLDRSKRGYDDSKIITPEEYVKHNPLLEPFVTNVNFHGSKLLCLECKDNNKLKKVYYLLIFTNNYIYEITTKYWPNKKPYISCYRVCRKEQPMEEWKRMSDLSDGQLCQKKLLVILSEIIESECENLNIAYTEEDEENDSAQVKGEENNKINC